MDYETFVRAVDSLDGYVGTIGMMGGEPTLNPEFEKMAEYLGSKKPQKVSDIMYRPQRHFMDSIHDLEFDHTFLYPCGGDMRQTVDGPGLWATTKGNYKKYYETIQDIAQYQALNDHSRPMYHQPGLISRKSLGIPDEEWIKLRDDCWIQNVWSASITPKGAFFCEVAASLDILFDGPGGWEIEPGWWKRMPDEFGDQLHWCEMCGLACKTFMRNANEQVYDVSEDIYERLKKSGSRLTDTDHINVVKIKDGAIDEESKAEGKRFSVSMPYTESYSARFDETTTKLTEKRLIGFVKCDRYEDLDYAVEAASFFEKTFVYAASDILENLKGKIDEKRLMEKNKYGDISYLHRDNTLGKAISDVVGEGNSEEYLMVIDGSIRIKSAVEDMKRVVLNPGSILFSSFEEPMLNDYFQVMGKGKVALLSGIAKSYKKIGTDRICKIEDVAELVELWDPDKTFPFHPDTVYTAPAIEVYPHKRYVIYGSGNFLGAAIHSITKSNAEIVAVVDSDNEKWGQIRRNYRVENPEKVLPDKNRYDYVMIGSRIFYREIKKILRGYGITEDKMAWV